MLRGERLRRDLWSADCLGTDVGVIPFAPSMSSPSSSVSISVSSGVADERVDVEGVVHGEADVFAQLLGKVGKRQLPDFADLTFEVSADGAAFADAVVQVL